MFSMPILGLSDLRPILLLAVVAIAACTAPIVSTAATSADNAAIARAFAEHRSNVEVTADGQVARLLADETSETGTHQRFVLALRGSSQTLLITNNVSIGRRVPVVVGDALVVHGEFVWNDQGGLIHFTHHDPDRSHEGGWIERQGIRYE
jgi:hypothetical protein